MNRNRRFLTRTIGVPSVRCRAGVGVLRHVPATAQRSQPSTQYRECIAKLNDRLHRKRLKGGIVVVVRAIGPHQFAEFFFL